MPPSPAGACFFDARVYERINAQEAADAAAKNKTPSFTPSFTVEESEFAMQRSRLPEFLADMKALVEAIDNRYKKAVCWTPSTIIFRPTGSTTGNISPTTVQAGSPHEPFVWIEYHMFRPNLPSRNQPRWQKRLSAVQEAFEQLMACK